MDRRAALGAVAAAAGLPLLASTAAAQSGRDATGGMPTGDAEAKHARETELLGSLSLAQSRLAESKASDAKVKEFVKFEVAEQETVGDILKSMKAAATSAKGALSPPTEAEVNEVLGEDGKAVVAKLEGTQAGKDFDREYVKSNLQGHRKLLTIQEDYLKTGKNREQLSVAKLARGMIREHIAHLEELQSKLA